MNIGKAFSLAMMPIGVLIILAVITGAAPLIQFGLSLIPFIGPTLAAMAGYVNCCLGPGIFLLYIVALAGIGFYIGKAGGMDITDAAIVGAIAGAIAQLISGLAGFAVNLISNVLGIASNVGSASSGGDVFAGILGAVGAGAGIISTICGSMLCLVGLAIVGAIIAVIGFFVGGAGKK
ncbi:MAG: hypothetical protein V1492_03060 [Candidatus Micrarchaeota archaeon]